MAPTRPATLAAAALAASMFGLLVALVGQRWFSGIPSPTLLTSALLVFVGVTLLWSRRAVRRWIDDPNTAPGMDALRAGRMVALAQATAWFGTLFGGLCLGLVIAALPELGRPYGQGIVTRAGVAAAASAFVAVAGVLLERACQDPAPPAAATATSDAA